MRVAGFLLVVAPDAGCDLSAGARPVPCRDVRGCRVEAPRALPELVRAETPTPPLSGGTLLIDGDVAFVADPDQDVVHLIAYPESV